MNFPQKARAFIEGLWLWLKYFFFFPLFSLFPPPFPYLLSRYLSRLDGWFNSSKKRALQKWMKSLLESDHPSRKELELTTRRYFEVVCSDDLDVYIYLFGFAGRFIRRLKIEGEEHLEEALKSNGGFILCTHFGGGFWILPFLERRGVKVQFFSTDVKKSDYASTAFYLYHRLINRTIGRMFQGKTLFKKDRKESLRTALEEGKWVSTAYDVPPFLVKEKTEVSFLGRKTFFPKGIMSLAKELNAPVLFFFSYLEDGRHRRIRFEKPMYVKDEEEAVRKSARLIEETIIERPDHWHLWPFADQFFGSDH